MPRVKESKTILIKNIDWVLKKKRSRLKWGSDNPTAETSVILFEIKIPAFQMA